MSSKMVFDGEAPETDDECDEIDEKPAKTPEKVEKIAETSQVYDKKLEKQWTKLAEEVICLTRKRTKPQEKVIEKITEQAAECFTSMQNVAAKLNIVHTNVTRLEDSVADLMEASKLIPTKMRDFQLDIPVL